MKKVFQILCFILIPALFFVGCSFTGTYNRNILLSDQGKTVVGTDYIEDDYDTDKEWSELTAEEITAQNPINEPDPSYYSPKYVYKFLGEDTLPICGYHQPKIKNLNAGRTSLETYVREFMESGCNIVIETHLASSDVDQHDFLGYLEQYGGMAFMVTTQLANAQGTIADEARKFKLQYDEYAEYSSFAGIHVIDEPGWVSWQGDYNTPGTLGYGQQVLNAVYNSKLFFVNLLPYYSPAWAFPNGATSGGAGGGLEPSTDYNEYYSTYIANVKPKVLCYDYYPLQGDFPGLKDSYYLQLAIINYYTNTYYKEYFGTESGIPFWNFIQIIGFGGTRAASYSEIIWQMNTALNFGSKGFAYFTYYSPDAPGHVVTGEGKRTEHYYDMQKANLYTQAFAKWMLNADIDAMIQYSVTPNGEYIPNINATTNSKKVLVRDVNGNSMYTGMNMQKSTYGMLDEISGNVPCLVSYMDYYSDNNNYDKFVTKADANKQDLLFVTNNTVDKSGDVTLTFDNEVSGSYVVAGKTFSFSGSSLTVNLGAGEAFAVLLDTSTYGARA